jgi:hypothetical protein
MSTTINLDQRENPLADLLRAPDRGFPRDPRIEYLEVVIPSPDPYDFYETAKRFSWREYGQVTVTFRYDEDFRNLTDLRFELAFHRHNAGWAISPNGIAAGVVLLTRLPAFADSMRALAEDLDVYSPKCPVAIDVISPEPLDCVARALGWSHCFVPGVQRQNITKETLDLIEQCNLSIRCSEVVIYQGRSMPPALPRSSGCRVDG